MNLEESMKAEWWNALVGGGLIGLAASLHLLFNGRVTGISGTLFGALSPKNGDLAWRIFLLTGLVLGGIILQIFHPTGFASGPVPTLFMVVAGLLVGFGTILGSGCTSGHGVCGISRFSPRSMVATLVFMFGGILCVWLVRRWGIW